MPPNNEPIQHSNGREFSLATELENPDAVCPAVQATMCSKIHSEFNWTSLNTRFTHTFPKQTSTSMRGSILHPTSVARRLRGVMSTTQEEFWILALSSSKKLLRCEMMFRGTADACLVHPRDVVRFLCHTNASSFIVAHNHPSGDPKPSHQDWAFTRRLVQCGHLVEIPLLDHVIVTAKTHTSLVALKPRLFEFSDFNERRLD